MSTTAVTPQQEFAENFGKLARGWREAAGMSLRSAAVKAKLNATHLEAVEGGWTILSLKDIAKISQTYGKRVMIRFLGSGEEESLDWDFEI